MKLLRLSTTGWTAKSQTKKSGFLRNRFFQTYVSTWSWPPDSPAKSYLKVFIFGNVVDLLWKDYAC